MIRKYLILSLLAMSLISVRAANSVTYTLAPNIATNLNTALPSVPAPLTITTVLVQANGTNVSLLAYDAPGYGLTNVIGAYTNTSYYATNMIVSYTNYFGVVNTYTNLQLALRTNTVVASTNSYPVKFGVSSLANVTTVYDNIAYHFSYGTLLTNNSTGTATVTVTYQQ